MATVPDPVLAELAIEEEKAEAVKAAAVMAAKMASDLVIRTTAEVARKMEAEHTVVKAPSIFTSPGAIGSMLIITALVILGSILRPESTEQYLGYGATLGAALLAYIKTTQNAGQIQELHLAVNSRLTQLIESTARASKSEGRDEQRAQDTHVIVADPKP